LIDWYSLRIDQVWPFWLLLIIALILTAVWFFHRTAHFPDMMLITNTVSHKGVLDRLAVIAGGIILLLLMLVMMAPSVYRNLILEQTARDFLVIVDTSRSMRHDTSVRRETVDLRFERRVGTFSTAVDDPSTLPLLARFELARESLLSFLEQRRAQDRVGMIYFNDDAFTMSAPTSNIDFIIEQLGLMDEYVNWGTDIATAMEAGLNLLDRYPEQNKKAIILLTDAEANYTKDVEAQLSRLASKGIAFYLLWITTDENNMSNDEVAALLNYVRSVGTVVTIENLDARNLENSLRDISRLESYSYEEIKRERIDLSLPVLQLAFFLLLIWLLLVATIFHPSTERNIFMRGKL